MLYPDDLAAKANIIIDPSEIQAVSMDDLDEDDESGAAQVKPPSPVCSYANACGRKNYSEREHYRVSSTYYLFMFSKSIT